MIVLIQSFHASGYPRSLQIAKGEAPLQTRHCPVTGSICIVALPFLLREASQAMFPPAFTWAVIASLHTMKVVGKYYSDS